MAVAIFVVIGMFSSIAASSEQLMGPAESNSNFQLSGVQPNENQVFIGLWLINVFDYHYTGGAYTIDAYVYFFWSSPNITTIDWLFANGYPITPSAITLIASNLTGAVKYETYRATAHLSSTPDAVEFPFDKINITAEIDVFPHGNNLTLSWLTNQTGLVPQFSNSGWKTDSYELNTTIHNYPLGVQVPRAEMVVTQERQRIGTSLSPFAPPTIFSLVCAVSFLFSLKDMGAVGLRIGLTTSMLVTTLLFSFGVSANIPPASSIVLYSIFLLSVLIFMVCNLIVTIVGVVGWVKYRNEKRTALANKLGFLISLTIAITFFAILFVLQP
jgi:hypothetical protein